MGSGVYRWADAPPADDDLVEVAERVPRVTLCLETALARHGLIDTIPAAIDIAIPRGATRLYGPVASVTRLACRWRSRLAMESAPQSLLADVALPVGWQADATLQALHASARKLTKVAQPGYQNESGRLLPDRDR